MRSLFIRIFLWFWLVMAMVVGLMVLSSPWWTQARPAVLEWERHVFTMMGRELDRVGEVVAVEGAQGAARMVGGDWDRDLRPGRRMRDELFVTGESGALVGGGEAPPEVYELAQEALERDEPALARDGTRFLMAQPIEDPQGKRLVAVLVSARGFRHHHPTEPPPPPISILSPGMLLPRLAAVVLLVGALCYWMSRYLTSPLRALRLAARGLADGDLGVRVAPRVARRHDEIGQLGRDFDTMAERLERMVGSQQRLIRDVSHELRSPLARLQVALELARDRSAEGGSQWLDRIEIEASRLDHLIGQQLVLARLEAGEGEGTRAAFRLDQMAAAVVAEAGLEAGVRGSQVHLIASQPLELDANEDLLRSALDNVLRNAIRFTTSGSSVEVTLEARPDAGGHEARLVVRDRGPGVPEGSLDELFEPFFRVEEARDRSRGGSGLGLAIAARAVRLHGGSISAANAAGGGLEVEIVLPGVRCVSEPQPPARLSGPDAGGSQAL